MIGGALTLLTLSCGGGSYEPTRIDDLRVVTIVAQPPEARPGSDVRATVWVANPDEAELEVMFWTCLYLEDGGCAESQIADELEQWVTIGSASSGTMETVRQIPREAEDYLVGEDVMVGIQVYALACQADTCGIIRRVQAAMDGVGVDEGIARDLADPTGWLDDLPMEGVSLATRDFVVSNRDPGSSNQNPEIDPRFAESLDDAIVMLPGATIDLAFFVDDPNGESVYVYPFTTIGTFDDRKVKAEDDQVRLYLTAPPTTGEGRVWVVFDDRDGGLAVYSQAVVVQ